jgi:hypothetical protein
MYFPREVVNVLAGYKKKNGVDCSWSGLTPPEPKKWVSCLNREKNKLHAAVNRDHFEFTDQIGYRITLLLLPDHCMLFTKFSTTCGLYKPIFTLFLLFCHKCHLRLPIRFTGEDGISRATCFIISANSTIDAES